MTHHLGNEPEPDALVPFRKYLADAREANVPFKQAWRSGQVLVPLGYVLLSTKDAWQRAYEGLPPEGTEAAPARMFEALEAGVSFTREWALAAEAAARAEAAAPTRLPKGPTGPKPKVRTNPDTPGGQREPGDGLCIECGRLAIGRHASLCSFHYLQATA